MKIMKNTLKQIIKEELRLLKESGSYTKDEIESVLEDAKSRDETAIDALRRIVQDALSKDGVISLIGRKTQILTISTLDQGNPIIKFNGDVITDEKILRDILFLLPSIRRNNSRF